MFEIIQSQWTVVTLYSTSAVMVSATGGGMISEQTHEGDSCRDW